MLFFSQLGERLAGKTKLSKLARENFREQIQTPDHINNSKIPIITLTLVTIVQYRGQLFSLVPLIKWKFFKNKSTISSSPKKIDLYIGSLQINIY